MNNNWLEDFFESNFYNRFWGWQLENDDTQKFAESSLELLNAKSGHILDWCGGWGRISVIYAEKGFEISLLDFNKAYLKKAEELFKKKNLQVNLIQSDCRSTPPEIKADFATCFFNSIGFFNDKEQILAFKSLFHSLNSNARILIDCMNLLFLIPYIKPVYDTQREDGYIFRQKNKFSFIDNVLHSDFEIIDNNGNLIENREFHQRLYTPMDIKNIVESAGFKNVRMYADLEGKEISSDESKIFLVAQK